jgi:hypothetical protein
MVSLDNIAQNMEISDKTGQFCTFLGKNVSFFGNYGVLLGHFCRSESQIAFWQLY